MNLICVLHGSQTSALSLKNGVYERKKNKLRIWVFLKKNIGTQPDSKPLECIIR
jgi:hypothetical protein